MIFRLSINAKHKFFHFALSYLLLHLSNPEKVFFRVAKVLARQRFRHGYTDDLSAFCEAQKKRQGISRCILKKIMIVCNYWGLLAPTHDFLFNPKTAFRY